MFADELIPARRKIIEYTGEKISRRETKRRAEGPLNYLFTLNPYWCIDGNVGGSGAQYVNHCCNPNCYAWIVKEHILYMSARDIQPGEELTLDYHFDKDVERVPCSLRRSQTAAARSTSRNSQSMIRQSIVLLDFEQAIVLCQPLGSRDRSDLDLSRA